MCSHGAGRWVFSKNQPGKPPRGLARTAGFSSRDQGTALSCGVSLRGSGLSKRSGQNR
jgi:hypothetical protein